MSLDYSYKNVVNSDEVMWDKEDRMLPEVQSVIFATMFTGVPVIKDEEAAVKLFTRYCKLQYANNYGEPFFTLALVKKLVGLATNASTITDAEFKKKLLDALDRTARSVIDREAREATENL